MPAGDSNAKSGAELLSPSCDGPAWRAAIAHGFDMSLVELSLKKAPWDRLLEHDEALAFAERLRNAANAAHARS